MNLEDLITEVQSTAKYRAIAPDLVRRIAAQEIAKGRSFKEAVKEVRARLHQVGSAYQEGGLDLVRWNKDLPNLPKDPKDPSLQKWCLEAMRHHASTRERLPVIEEFFSTVLREIAPIRSVVDLACGLNPLAMAWMPLDEQAPYYACEIYPELVNFLNDFLKHTARGGEVEVLDLSDPLAAKHFQPVHLALLLKTLPCLEQVEKGISLRLLDGIQAEYVLVSFPARSLGGRAKGMPRNYETNFREMVAGRSWGIQRFEFQTELAFLVHKAEAG